MDVTTSEAQQAVADAARGLLQRRGGVARARGIVDGGGSLVDHPLWAEVIGLGWAGLVVPEAHGGLGLGMSEAVVLLEEAGRTLAPLPLLSTTWAALAVTALGSPLQQETLLPALAEGTTQVALAVDEPGRYGPPRAEVLRHRGGLRLRGEKTLVVDGASAGVLLVLVANREQLGLVVVPASADGVEVTRQQTFDATRDYARLRLRDVAVPLEALLGSDDERSSGVTAADVVDRCRVVLAAELVGVGSQALSSAAAYVSERRQFGTAVGSYQGVSHPLARARIALQSASSLVAYAAWCADHGDDRGPESAAMAKAAAGDAACEATATSIQSHGGIGFTWETDPHLFLKRARAGQALLGDASWQRERIAQLVLDR